MVQFVPFLFSVSLSI